jgi:hypothetical protein
MINGFHSGDPPSGHGPGSAGETEWMPEIVVMHLTLALCGHVCRLHRQGLPVPREVQEQKHS